jgi:hypothetical protein
MAKTPEPVYNEPVRSPRGDVVPAVKRITRLPPMVKARLEIELELRRCGLEPRKRPFRYTRAHKTVLVKLLSEFDAPKTASLRARAAGVAGPLKLTEAAAHLRSIALDNDEDFATRFHAITSYVKLRPESSMPFVARLLRSKDAWIRAVTQVAALRSTDQKVAAIGRSGWTRERNQRVQRWVVGRVPSMVASDRTARDRG